MSIKVNKLKFLEFVRKNKVVTATYLISEFGYTERGARIKLHRLYKQGLLDRLHRGEYILTEEAFRRLRYYGKL